MLTPPLPRHRQEGFTLIELLLAMVISLLLLGVVLFTFTVMFNTTRAQARWHANLSPADAALEALGRDLACALAPLGLTNCPFSLSYSNDGQRPLCSLSFYTAVAPPFVSNDWRTYRVDQVCYSVRPLPDRTSLALVRDVQPFRCAATNERYGEEVLCDGIGQFEVLMFDGQDWTNRWGVAGQNQLPLAAQMKLVLDLETESPVIETTVLIPAGHVIAPVSPVK